MIILPQRGVVTLTGKDSFSFLQNIITANINNVGSARPLRGCLLSPQGKFLHDFFITREGDTYFLECEGGPRTDDLAKRLSLYKLRANVIISTNPDLTVYADKDNNKRAFVPFDEAEEPFEVWDESRIRQGLPDGSRDAEIGVSTLAELNLDDIAVSYTKGCYIGQEIVARMHNRNLGKKHLIPVLFEVTPPSAGTIMEELGIMRSSCGNIGLILMNRDTEEQLQQGLIKNAPFRLLGL